MNVLTTICVIVSISWTAGEMMSGGLTEDEHIPSEKGDPVVEIIPKISKDIRSQVSAKLASGDSGSQNAVNDNDPIIVLAYKSQVVAGINYYVRAEVGKYIFHLRIYKPLPHQGEPSLSDVKGPVNKSDPIVYF